MNDINDLLRKFEKINFNPDQVMPFFIYDESKIKSNIKQLKDQLTKLGLSTPTSKYFFSMKSNPNLQLLKVISKDFSGIDVSSEREYDTVRNAGYLPEDISVSGPAKKDAFLKKLLIDSVYAIHIDSSDEFNSIFKINSSVNNTKTLFNLRVNVDESSSKLGMSFEDCFSKIKMNESRINGLHFYMGREKFDAERMSVLLKRISNEIIPKKRASKFKIFIGPGFSSSDLTKVGFSPLVDVDAFEFHFEMGRVVLETAGAYFSEILSVKESGSGKKEIIVNGGIQHLATGMINVFKKVRETILFGRSLNILSGSEEANVFGSLCLSNDLLAVVDTCPQDISRGDWIYFYPCGAYNISASASEFIMQDRPRSFLFSENSIAEI